MIVNGHELGVEVEGTGPAVLCLHGLGGTSNFFQVQAEALVRDHRVIRIDSAGAGRSPVVEGISVANHVEDANAVLDALGVTQAVVVAHSLGTLVARQLAASHPEKVVALGLLGTVAPPADGGTIQHARAALLRAEGTLPVAIAVVASATSPATRSDRPEIAAFVREMVMRQDPEGYARNYEALANASDPGPVDPSLPLLLVDGSDDAIRDPDVGRSLAQAHGSATVELIDGVGHWIAIEAAGRCTAVLSSFLRTLPVQNRFMAPS